MSPRLSPVPYCPVPVSQAKGPSLRGNCYLLIVVAVIIIYTVVETRQCMYKINVQD